MEVEAHIDSVKAKSQAGIIWVKDIMTTQKGQSCKISARDLKVLCILPENSAEGLRSMREHCWCYIFVFENTPEMLPQLYIIVQGRVQLEHSSHIFNKVGVKATC